MKPEDKAHLENKITEFLAEHPGEYIAARLDVHREIWSDIKGFRTTHRKELAALSRQDDSDPVWLYEAGAALDRIMHTNILYATEDSGSMPDWIEAVKEAEEDVQKLIRRITEKRETLSGLRIPEISSQN